MHLTDIFVRNVGPIEALDFDLPFRTNNSPKPVVLVGKNGSGKSTALAQIADGLWELSAQVFDDITNLTPGGGRPYLLPIGGNYYRSGSDHSLALMTFRDEAGRDIHYRAKSGTLDRSTLMPVLNGRFDPVINWSTEDTTKQVKPVNEKDTQNAIRAASLSFFPSWRSERPHWINKIIADSQPDYTDNQTFTRLLGRELVVVESAEANKAWIRDLILDSRPSVDLVTSSSSSTTVPLQVRLADDRWGFLPAHQGLTNVNAILQRILCDSQARIIVGNRSSSYRVAIRTQSGAVLNSLSHLSAGQAVLFNLFATIIRYADLADANKAMNLSSIRGIALVDEIDAHLDSQLQREVLPNLISMLPNVQFIVTSHSPLFLLGMEAEFGPDGFQCHEMPEATLITAERFSEFEDSYRYFLETARHEEHLRALHAKSQRPLVLTEGKTDALHLKHAFQVLGKTELLDEVDIEEVGHPESIGTRGGGVPGLNNTWNVLTRRNPSEQRLTLLLYDHDANRPDEQVGNVFIRSITKNADNQSIDKGIENLLPESLFDKRFYSEKEKRDGYGAVSLIRQFDKMAFFDWVRENHTDIETFRAFDPVAQTIENVLEQHSLGRTTNGR